MDAITKDLARQVYRQLEGGAAEPRVKMAARDKLSDVREELIELRSEDHYRDFLTSFLQREREKFLADGADDHPFDGHRPDDKPLCLCSLGGQVCPVKRGLLPPTVKDAPTIDEGIREFTETHTGYPVVFDDAREVRREKQARVEDTLTVITISLANNTPVYELEAEHIPDVDAENVTEENPV